jgi:hypothetical protein
VSNDTKDRIEAKIKTIDENVSFLNTFSKLFVPREDIPFEVTQEIKQHNRKILLEFVENTEI